MRDAALSSVTMVRVRQGNATLFEQLNGDVAKLVFFLSGAACRYRSPVACHKHTYKDKAHMHKVPE